MIREFIKVNDSDYVLSDNFGNMRMINLGDDITAEEYIIVENELEYYTNCLKKCENKIKLINFNRFLKKYIQIPGSLIIAAIVIFFSEAVKSLLIYEQVACLVGSNILFNTLMNFMFGSFRKNRKKFKNCIVQHNELQEKIDTLKEVLSDIKEKTSFIEYKEEFEEKAMVEKEKVIGKKIDLVESYAGRHVFCEPEYTFKKRIRVLKKD